MRRKFKGQELSLAVKGLENKRQEKEWILYQLEYHKLMLEKGLKMNYEKNIRDFTAQKHGFETELRMVEETIRVLEEQIREGVTIKEDVKGGNK